MNPHFFESGAIISLSKDVLLIGYGKPCWSAQPLYLPAFYFPDFFLKKKKPWLSFEHSYQLSIDELQLKTEQPLSLNWQWPSRLLFEQTFEQLQTHIQRGILKKAVPYVFAKAKARKWKLQGVLKSVLDYAQKSSTFIYGFWTADEGLLGSTPEMLFHYHKDKPYHFSTMALAGTSTHEGLLTDYKEIQEQQFVIEGIKKALPQESKLNLGKTELLKLPHLMHLLTRIEVHIPYEVDFNKLIHWLHPTPALGAFPKEAGWKWLKAYQQKIDRGRFGAPVGVFLTDQAHCLVAIRNMQWKRQEIKIGAGCGVIKESLCEREWQELLLKINHTRHILSV